MNSFENSVYSILRHPKFAKNAVIGFILSLIPVLNLLSLNYLKTFGTFRSKSSKIEFPDWTSIFSEMKKNPYKEIISTLFLFCEFLVIVILPVMIFAAIFSVLNRCLLGIFIGLFFSAPAFAYTLTCPRRIFEKNIITSFQNLKTVVGIVLLNQKKLAIPSLGFLLLQIISVVTLSKLFIPSTGFVGFMFLIEYAKRLNLSSL